MVCEDVMMATFDSRGINTDRWRDCLTERWLLDLYKLEGAKFILSLSCGECNAEAGQLHWKDGHSIVMPQVLWLWVVFLFGYREAFFLPWEYICLREFPVGRSLLFYFTRRLVIACQNVLKFPGDFTNHLLQTHVWLLELWIWHTMFFFLRLHMQLLSTNARCHCGSWKHAAPCWTAQCRLAREIRHKVYELKPRTELGLWESKEYLMRNQW